MNSKPPISAVAIYNTHTDAEAAIKELQSSGLDMRRLSIVGKDYRPDDHVVGYYNTGDRLKYWGKLGAFWGGIRSLLVGEAFFWMPDVGPIMVGGALVSSIVVALEGATVHTGLTAVGSALHAMGIPKSSALNYESALKANKFILVVHGTNGEASKATEILRRTEAIELATHGDETGGDDVRGVRAEPLAAQS
jgi:hypothetical protein